MKITSFFLALAVFALVAGCESTTDPLAAGWKSVTPIGYKVGEMSADISPIPGYPTISDDVQKFVNQLPVDHLADYAGGGTRRWCYWIFGVTLFEDGTGQHAVKIEINRVNHDENYVLIYNKSNIRIKTIRFSSGHYAS
jgi:hypothetical protein